MGIKEISILPPNLNYRLRNSLLNVATKLVPVVGLTNDLLELSIKQLPFSFAELFPDSKSTSKFLRLPSNYFSAQSTSIIFPQGFPVAVAEHISSISNEDAILFINFLFSKHAILSRYHQYCTKNQNISSERTVSLSEVVLDQSIDKKIHRKPNSINPENASVTDLNAAAHFSSVFPPGTTLPLIPRKHDVLWYAIYMKLHNILPFVAHLPHSIGLRTMSLESLLRIFGNAAIFSDDIMFVAERVATIHHFLDREMPMNRNLSNLLNNQSNIPFPLRNKLKDEKFSNRWNSRILSHGPQFDPRLEQSFPHLPEKYNTSLRFDWYANRLKIGALLSVCLLSMVGESENLITTTGECARNLQDLTGTVALINNTLSHFFK